MTVHYVSGYAFDENKSRVILLIKEKPIFFKGKLMPPGGKVEGDESIQEAIAREFHEETGVLTSEFAWVAVGQITVNDFNGEAAVCDFLTTVLDNDLFETAATMEDEKVIQMNIDDLSLKSIDGDTMAMLISAISHECNPLYTTVVKVV